MGLHSRANGGLGLGLGAELVPPIQSIHLSYIDLIEVSIIQFVFFLGFVNHCKSL